MQLNPRILKIAGIAVATIVALLLIIPMFIPVDSFRPRIESALTTALGRPVTLGKLGLSIFSGSVTVDDVKIADDPAFSQSPFITAKSLKVGVEVFPLIFSKQLNVTGIELVQPQITLLKSASGTWNFSSLGGKSAQKAPPEKSGSQNLSIAKLEIKDARLSVGQANSSAKPQVYENLNATMTDFSATSRFPFEVTTDLPGGGNANLSGKAGPINATDSSKTPFDAIIKVRKLDLAASGFVAPESGIAGLANVDGTLTSDGRQAKAAGTVTCDKVKLSPKGTPAPESVSLKYGLVSDLASQALTVSQGDIAVGKATARLTGGAQTQGNVQIFNLKLNAPNMSVDELQTFLPAMGVTLPSGSKLKGGTLSADLSLTGPLDKLVVSGPIRMSNTKLAGFDMGAKLGALSAFAGKGVPASGDTTIQNASLNARLAPEGTRADSINVTIPSLGVVNGAGTISPTGALDFKMNADLQSARNQLGAIPFMIQGTTANPSFVPDVGALAGSAIKNAIAPKVGGKGADPVSSITGLFGKKKK